MLGLLRLYHVTMQWAVNRAVTVCGDGASAVIQCHPSSTPLRSCKVVGLKMLGCGMLL